MNPLLDRCLPTHVPSMSGAAAERLAREGQAVYAMTTLPGWQVIRGLLDNIIDTAVSERCTASPAALAVMQKCMVGAGALARRFRARTLLCKKAIERMRDLRAGVQEPVEAVMIDPLAVFGMIPGAPRVEEFTPQSAEKAVREADEVAQAIASPGWPILLDDLVAEVWTRYCELEDCEAADAPAHQAAISSLDALLNQIRQKLARRDVAAAFLRGRANARADDQ